MRAAVVLGHSYAAAWEDQCIAALREVPGLSVRLFSQSMKRLSAEARGARPPATGALRAVEISHSAELEDAAQLSQHEFDFVLDLSGTLNESDAKDFRLGVWRYETRGAKTIDRFISWREFSAGARTLDMALVARTGDASPRVLRSARFNLPLRLRGLDPILQGCSQWAAWSAQEWASSGLDTASRWEQRTSVNFPKVLTAPARLLYRVCRRAVRHLLARVDWNIGIIPNATPDEFLKPGYRPAIRWLRWDQPHPFYADPMVASQGGKTFILCESLDRRAHRGHIDAFEIFGSVPVNQKPVMRQLSHLSYPFLFEYGGAYYCVPESAEKNCVELYRSTSFPYEWARVGTLIEGFDACDSTLFRHDDKWWLFCTSANNGPNLHLFAFHADRLTGPWTAHARNPIKSDITSARPAGKPFFHQGHLYRPSQDCASTYGGALRINRILRLTTDEFEEEIVATLLPRSLHPYTAGTHTLSWDGDVCVIDGKRRYLSFRRLFEVLGRANVKAARRSAAVPGPLLEPKPEAVQ